MLVIQMMQQPVTEDEVKVSNQFLELQAGDIAKQEPMPWVFLPRSSYSIPRDINPEVTLRREHVGEVPRPTREFKNGQRVQTLPRARPANFELTGKNRFLLRMSSVDVVL